MLSRLSAKSARLDPSPGEPTMEEIGEDLAEAPDDDPVFLTRVPKGVQAEDGQEWLTTRFREQTGTKVQESISQPSCIPLFPGCCSPPFSGFFHRRRE